MLRVGEHSLYRAVKPSAVRIMSLLSGVMCLARCLVAINAGPSVIEASLGALLEIIAASAATYMDPSLRDMRRRLLIVGGSAGLSGALGTRLLDLLVAGLQRRFGP